MQVELPTAYDWGTLNAVDSIKHISIGVTAKKTDNGWSTGYNTATFYSGVTTPELIGTLDAGKVGTLSMSANYGRAIEQTQTVYI